jgi:hypothetical protein
MLPILSGLLLPILLLKRPKMFYNYAPYSYRRRYYHLDPHYYYRKYYNPFYSVIGSQIATSDQSIINYGKMTDVIQDSKIFQSRSSKPSAPEIEEAEEDDDEI